MINRSNLRYAICGDSAASKPRLIKKTREPLGDVVDTEEKLLQVCKLISATKGSVALDTERAGSFRYCQGAYLVQIRREGCGTFLIDPQAFKNLSALDSAIGKNEWILHDAAQDMPCLAEIGMTPSLLFDTELAAKLLNIKRFGLSAVTEYALGITLAKEYSAVNWSIRPLPADWLNYAALDVEFLIELRQVLWSELENQHKNEWAIQEFNHLLHYKAPPPKPDPWRHVPGSGKVNNPRSLAALRELWETREKIAANENLAPAKVLSNPALIALAVCLPKGRRYLNSIQEFRHDYLGRRRADNWCAALSRARKIPAQDLPPRCAPRRHDLAPDARISARNHPQEACRWHRLRTVISQVAQKLDVFSETMLEPRTVRRLAWVLPDNARESQVLEVLQTSEARPWQIEHLLEPLVKALQTK